MNANYPVHLPVIEMVFGTYKCPRGQWPAEYDIVSGKPPKGIVKQFLHPFFRKKKKKANSSTT